jgi:hypothetical protein
MIISVLIMLAVEAIRLGGCTLYLCKDASVALDFCVEDLHFILFREGQLWAVRKLGACGKCLLFDGLELIKID